MEATLADPVTGLTPAPAGGQQPFSFAAAPFGPSFDPIELLPPAAQDRLRKLRIGRDDARALTIPFADISEASAARTNAANALKRLTDHPQSFGFNLKPEDRRVIEAQKLLDKLTDDFKRLQERQAARAAAFQAASQALANVEAWLRDGRPSGTTLEDHPTPEVKLNKGESLADAISRLARRTRELRADLHRISSSPFPSAWAKAQMREQVEALAARGEPDVSVLVERGANIVWPTLRLQVTVYNAQPGAVGYAEVPDVLAIEAYLHKDAMIAALAREITSEADDKAAMTHEARQKAEAEVLGDLLDIERQEANLVWRAQGEGLPCEHRADCSPLAILQVQLVTVPRADAAGTSRTHAYDIVLGGRR